MPAADVFSGDLVRRSHRRPPSRARDRNRVCCRALRARLDSARVASRPIVRVYELCARAICGRPRSRRCVDTKHR